MDRGLGLLMRINWDRMLAVLAVFVSLSTGAWLASIF
jgi:hypothetical protein